MLVVGQDSKDEQALELKSSPSGLRRTINGSIALPRTTRASAELRLSGSGIRPPAEDPNSTNTKLQLFSTSKVLSGVTTRLQVCLARQSKYQDFGDSEDPIFQAGATAPDNNYLMVLAQGNAEVSVPSEDGKDVVVGTVGQGAILGGLLAFGMVSRHLMTVRWAHDEVDGDEEFARRLPSKCCRNKEKRAPRAGYVLTGREVADLERNFGEEVDSLRLRILKNLRAFLLPQLARFAKFSFFRRYTSEFVDSVVHDMDLCICKPKELIFEQNREAQSMAMLFCGSIEVWINGNKIFETSQPGTCFGEAALLEEDGLRSATVQCGTMTDSLICFVNRADFMRTLDKFPAERQRLQEHVRHRVAGLCMRETFAGCDHNFLEFLSGLCETLNLKPGSYACQEGHGPVEALHICRHGEAIVQKQGSVTAVLRKGDAIGFGPTLGLAEQAFPDYTIVGGSGGCLLIRITREVLEQALSCFPAEVRKLLSAVGIEKVPEDHPFQGKHNRIWEAAHKLISSAFMISDIGSQTAQALEPFFKVAIYDAGVAITKEGQEFGSMTMLMQGKVSWTREGRAYTDAEAPKFFDEAIALGLHTRCRATICAVTPCVAWHLPAYAAWHMQRESNPALVDVITDIMEEAADTRKALRGNIQARLRNMKAFRKLKSEILEFISSNAEVHTFLPGETAFEEGQPGDCMYVLLRGKVEIIKCGKSALLEEGATFGEDALNGIPRCCTVRATTLCICDVLFASTVDYAFAEYPELREYAGLGPACRQRAKTQVGDVVGVVNKIQRFAQGRKTAKGSVVFSPNSTHRSFVSRNSTLGSLNYSRKTSEASFSSSSSSDSDRAVNLGRRGTTYMPGRQKSKSRSQTLRGDVNVDKLRASVSVAIEKCGTKEDDRREADQHEPSFRPRGAVDRLVDKSFRHDEEVDTKYTEPRNLVRRFQKLSHLHDDVVPRLPLALPELYQTPPEVEEDLTATFKLVFPSSAMVASCRMHGVLSRASGTGREAQEDFPRRRAPRAWPTHTTPLPPVPPTVSRMLLGAHAPSAEDDRTIGIASKLQLFASGLMRINSKTKLGLGRDDSVENCDKHASCSATPVTVAQHNCNGGERRWQPSRRKNVRLARLYVGSGAASSLELSAAQKAEEGTSVRRKGEGGRAKVRTAMRAQRPLPNQRRAAQYGELARKLAHLSAGGGRATNVCPQPCLDDGAPMDQTLGQDSSTVGEHGMEQTITELDTDSAAVSSAVGEDGDRTDGCKSVSTSASDAAQTPMPDSEAMKTSSKELGHRRGTLLEVLRAATRKMSKMRRHPATSPRTANSRQALLVSEASTLTDEEDSEAPGAGVTHKLPRDLRCLPAYGFDSLYSRFSPGRDQYLQETCPSEGEPSLPTLVIGDSPGDSRLGSRNSSDNWTAAVVQAGSEHGGAVEENEPPDVTVVSSAVAYVTNLAAIASFAATTKENQ